MDLTAAVEFAAAHREGVLTTMRGDSLPQLSNVNYYVDDGDIRASITENRAKYKNLMRRPWAALHVSSEDFFSYAVLEGDVTLAPIASSPDDATVEELVDLYRIIRGEHDDWSEYRAAMVADRRTVARLTPTRAWGLPSRA